MMRADARRNRDHLVAAATDVIAEEGPEASLNEIARRAGVGPGTLYRHFPTRESLLTTVFRTRIEALCARAGDLAAKLPPGEALTAWLHELLAHAVTDRGLGATMMLTEQESGFDCSALMAAAASGLLAGAGEAGSVRRDLTVDDLFQLVHGISLAAGDLGRGDRLLTLTLEGLRAA
ncbi:TetR/AcrR family transcriptional regulator [Streptosporangium sp. KLBMP 9127]|nr:TetR/AcrR family transcriptional regulator [Streptosporangium sp. KLBMP 9127]